jgi:serine/threonine protein kinase
MLYGVPPFNPKKGAHVTDLINLIEKGDLKFPPEVQASEDVKDLLRKCLVNKVEDRMSVEEFFAHPWVNEEKSIEKSESKLNI